MKSFKKILDGYFNRPVMYDYIIATAISICLFMLEKFDQITIPDNSRLTDLSSDIGSVGLTISGFILTLLTILVTLKTSEDAFQVSESNKIKKEDEKASGDVVDHRLTNRSKSLSIFFASPLYFKAADILRYAVISLVLISLTIYLLNIMTTEHCLGILFYADIAGILIIFTTFFRSAYILKSLVKLQKE